MVFSSKGGFTPLMTACYYSHIEAVQYLVSKGSHIHCKNVKGVSLAKVPM